MNYRDEFRDIEREVFWTAPRAIFAGFCVLVVMYGFGFLATGGDLAIYRFWAPKQENAKRVVFENTQSYVQGKVEYLSRLRLQYQSADPASTQRAALRTMILTEASTVDRGKLPPDIQGFLSSLVEGGLR